MYSFDSTIGLRIIIIIIIMVYLPGFYKIR